MMLNEGNCLSVSNIKRSIDLMDEFVDGDYEYLELKNWFSVIDSRNRDIRYMTIPEECRSL